jgi:hypothetical protein
MSLMTHEDTVPWGESIRVELLAGHMPPWSVNSAPGRFHNARPLTAREMNVLLTWATGGTPPGSPDKAPAPAAPDRTWPLGPPDVELPFPDAFTIPAGRQEAFADFTIPTGATERRWVRAVDLRPGTPAVVRGATVEIASTSEPLLALWLPGDEPVATAAGAAFELPAGAVLRVRVHYRKTWQYEQHEMQDRSTVGLYLAKEPSTPIRALALLPVTSTTDAVSRRHSVSRTLDEDVRALAIYPNQALARSGVKVTAVAPGGVRTTLIDFHPRAGWARRFWFREPIALHRGTTIETTVTYDDEPMTLPPGAAGPVAPRPDRSALGLTLNVVAAGP